jgi:hypothetical protein
MNARKIVCIVESRVSLVYRIESVTPFILNEASAESQTILIHTLPPQHGAVSLVPRYRFRPHLFLLTYYLMGARTPRGLATIFAFTVRSGLCAVLWHNRTQLFAPRL